MKIRLEPFMFKDPLLPMDNPEVIYWKAQAINDTFQAPYGDVGQGATKQAALDNLKLKYLTDKAARKAEAQRVQAEKDLKAQTEIVEVKWD